MIKLASFSLCILSLSFSSIAQSAEKNAAVLVKKPQYNYTCPDTYQGQPFQAATANTQSHVGYCGYQTIQFLVPHGVVPYGGLWRTYPNTFNWSCGPGFPASNCQFAVIN